LFPLSETGQGYHVRRLESIAQGYGMALCGS
jgi:hypothetical protein